MDPSEVQKATLPMGNDGQEKIHVRVCFGRHTRPVGCEGRSGPAAPVSRA